MLSCGLFMAGFGLDAEAAEDFKRAEVKPSVAVKETIDASKLSNAWDKTFPEDQRVAHQKVTFHNRFGITLVGDLYTPKNHKAGEKYEAIALAGPYGAVKEQVSGRYAQELAARGFLTRPLRGNLQGNPETPRLRTSTRRTSPQRWTICPTAMT